MPPRQDPETDLKRLNRDANQGLPVKGIKATWKANRPSVLPTRNANKVRALLSLAPSN